MPYWIEVANTERFVKRTIVKVYYKVKMGAKGSITSYEKTSCYARRDIFQSCLWVSSLAGLDGRGGLA